MIGPEATQLVQYGQVAWEYLLTHLVIVQYEGYILACSLEPSTNELMCKLIDVVNVVE